MRNPAFLLLLLVTAGGCTERGMAPPRIESLQEDEAIRRHEGINVATANLWGVSVLGMDWTDEIDARFAELAVRLGRNVPELDVVLIQEAWKDGARRRLLADEGVIRNFPHRVDALEAPGGSGLVILSRFPIVRAEFHRFRAQGRCFKFWEGDCLSGKGVLAVQARIGEDLYWIANTHLIACYPNDEASETNCDQQDPNGDVRFSQVVETREFMEQLTGAEPALIGGDFNLTRSSRYYPAMTSRRIPADPPEASPSDLSTHENRGWSETGELNVTVERIDYIWTRRGRSVQWHARGGARLIFTDPVELDEGRAIPISDHPILAVSYCLTHSEGESGTASCGSPRP
ncbi:MAG: endonuclease/exonuclease/phosphatase family protein [Proteobacteria bacterium]|nr:endonuclease/exonuclease/phosphatase family protein [Pseudomonadota bacterium]